MKPRTKLHVKVFALSQSLPEITLEQQEWALKNCLQHKGYRTKTAISCLDCGHVWPGLQKIKSCSCPKCGVKLKLEDSRKKKFDQMATFGVLDIREDFQITRFFKINSYHKAGTVRRTWMTEVVQHFIQPGKKIQIVAKNRMYNWSMDSFHGSLEIRDPNTIWNKYNLYVDKVLPGGKCLPIYKRNGFKGFFSDITPYNMFTKILTDSKCETLLKEKQYGLLEVATGRDRSGAIWSSWNSIKICIRNGYVVKDAGMWLDYLQLLRHFGKDTSSPKYVCPPNVKQAHDKLVSKKREIERLSQLEKNRIEAELRKKRAVAEQKRYIEDKGVYFGLVFSNKNLTIKVLESVQEFIEEGEIHKHCVFTNSYYKKADSLCFSARVNGKPVETIEVSLSEMKVLQSRGLSNKASIYNQQIKDLLNKNMDVIKRRSKELKDVAA